VSGGESFSESRYGHRALLKTLPAAHDRYFLCLLCSTSTNTKLPLKPDAVKILITDCPQHVKRNPSLSTPSGVATNEVPMQNDARSI
jgi:hypothetical protein